MLGRTVLTIVAVATMAVLVTAPATAADQPDGEDEGAVVTSYLNTVSPASIHPGDTLTLAGVVENTGDEPLTNVQALPRWSNVQLETRGEIHRVATDETLRWGLRRDDPYQIVAQRLPAGERREFSLQIGADDMGLGLAGVYAVGVDIRGTLANGERITLDTTRTVVPWTPEDDPATVQVSLLWPVEAPPSLLPDGALRSDAMADRLAADGSLDAIVDAADTSPVSWLLDPDLRDTVNAMADGYQTGADPGERSEGTGADLASAWWSNLSEAFAGSTPFLLPYARPDVGALLARAPTLAAELTRESVEATSDVARTMGPVRTGVARPDDDADVSDDVLALLADSGVRTVILSGSTVASAPAHPLAQMSTSAGDVDVILTDPGLDSALADAYAAADTTAGITDLRQRWTAETAMAALQAEAQGAQPQPLVVAPPPRWTPGHELASAVVDTWTTIPWVEPTPVTDLAEPARRVTVAPSAGDAANTLPDDNVAATAELRDAAADYTDLLADPDPSYVDGLAHATLRAASTGWRDDPAAGVAYASTITDGLTHQLEEVEVTVPESVTLSSRTGVFPLTVTNDLDRPVTVKLDVHAANPDRLRIGDIEEQRVEPGARETVEVRAEAATNGRVPITVQLITSDGSPLGPTTQTVVNATDYGTIGWVIIAGAAGVFGVSVLRTTLRRKRGLGGGDAAPGDDDVASDSTDREVAGKADEERVGPASRRQLPAEAQGVTP